MTETVEIVRVCDRPDLAAELEAAVAGAFPRFFLFDRIWNEVFPQVLECFADLQLLGLVEGRAAAMLNSVALHWDGSVAGLPAGEHAVMIGSVAERRRGVEPNTLCGIQAVMLPEFLGTGLVTEFIDAAAGAVGPYDFRISPIRPTIKELYPTATLEEYLSWRTSDREPFDPWLRIQKRRGAVELALCHDSLVMEGTVAEWEDWCEMAFPVSGSYVIAGGQFPLSIDRERDHGRYSECHVWMQIAGPRP